MPARARPASRQKSLGCRNSTGLPCAPIFGIAVAQHAGAVGLEPVARGDDVVDLVAEVMHAAGRILFQEGGDRRGLAQRLQQFDLGVADIDEDDRHAVLGQRLAALTVAPSISR